MGTPAPSPLLAVILVTSSSRGASISFRYPKKPVLEKRYSRVKYLVASADEEAANTSAGRKTGRGGNLGPARAQDGYPPDRGEDVSRAGPSSVGTPVWEQDEMDDGLDQSASDLSEDLDDYSDSASDDSSVSEYAGAADDSTQQFSGGRDVDDEGALSTSEVTDPDDGLDVMTSSRRDINQQQQHQYETASSAAGTATTRETSAQAAAEQARRKLRAYQQYLGYDTEILASMLAPKRELCHQKFELVIDDLAFVGHPVCVDNDGLWDPELERAQSGRGRDTSRRADVQGYHIGESREDGVDDTTRNGGRIHSVAHKGTAAPMTLFHLVLVLDRPDPSPYIPTLDLTSWLQIFYDNIAFKMTAALFAEEVRCGYVSRESDKLGALRDRCMDDRQSYSSFLTQALLVSSLARSLQQVHSSISVSSHAFVAINDSIDAHLQLPKMLQDPARMAHIADVEAPIDIIDPVFQRQGSALGPLTSEDVLFEEWHRTTGPFLLPWKTLLLLHEDQKSRHGAAFGGLDIEEDDDPSEILDPAEHGIEAWAKRFTSLLKPTLEGAPTLADMADLLDWRLEEDVYPMVRHLIYYREARVVDVPRIQNFYAVSPLFELTSLAKLSMSWALRFPALPPLASFLATLSSASRPFSSLLGRRDQRQLCLDVLIWLLRHEIVVQMHVRLRLVASEECKQRAALVRNEERKQIEARRAQRVMRQQRAAEAREAITSMKDVHANPAVLSRSAPATADVLGSGEVFERGRSRERSRSPHTSQERPVMTSILSATRPDPSTEGAGSTPGLNIDSRHQAHSSQKAQALHQQDNRAPETGDLVFERRRVLRSRSPSRMLGIAAGGVGRSAGVASGGSLGTQGSGSSRPSTPRGRPSGTTRPGDASVNSLSNGGSGESRVRVPLPSTGQPGALPSIPQHPPAHPQSMPFPPVSIAQSRSGLSSAIGVSTHADRRARSPSQARLRVTGFGADEEVYLESQENASLSEQECVNKEASDEAEAGGDVTLSPGHFKRLHLAEDEDVVRGEILNKNGPSGDGAISSEGRYGSQTKHAETTNSEKEGHATSPSMTLLHLDEQREDDEEDDMLMDHDIPVEPWEMNPVESIIAEPSRASGDENEWIAAIVEGRDSWAVERLYKWVLGRRRGNVPGGPRKQKRWSLTR